MDVNRYYVPPKPKKDNVELREARHKAATSRFKFNQSTTRLPTPQAFFERQRKFKVADKQAMFRFAKKKVVKHNLKLRRKELKQQQQQQMDELRSRMRKNTFLKEEEPTKLEAPETTEDVEDHEGIELNKLQTALVEQDEHEINRNVLVNFFELKDPDRVAEVDDLLAANKGKEAEFFDKITKDYKVVRETGRSKARESLEVTARTGKLQKPSSSFVEGNIEDAIQVNNKPRRATRTSMRNSSFFAGKALKTIPSAGSLLAAEGSVASVDSILSVGSDVEGVKEFQTALDKEIKAKKHHGEYVTSIKERGGQWWVNQAAPKVHPSQRRRNTLLDDLRNGNVPISL